MDETEQEQSGKKHCDRHPKVDVRENVGRTATRCFSRAHRFDVTPEKKTDWGALYTADDRGGQNRIANRLAGQSPAILR